MGIRWTTAFVDRAADELDLALGFWTAATGSTPSAWRGNRGEFATLLPPDGDAYLRVQRVEHGGGVHLDLHVDDVDAFTDHAVAVGAGVERPDGRPAVLRSPSGMVACVVASRGESVRPSPRRSSGGTLCLVDQVCIDVPDHGFEEETRFWSALTGQELRPSSVRREFSVLVRPPSLPVRLLLQRRDDRDGPARAHLDIASQDVEGVVADHERLGATVVARREHWTTLKDATGFEYCVTGRDPVTGVLPER